MSITKLVYFEIKCSICGEVETFQWDRKQRAIKDARENSGWMIGVKDICFDCQKEISRELEDKP